MPALRIQLFGTVNVSHDGRSLDTRLIHAVQSLLAWLLLHRRKMHARDALAALFWSDQSDARARSCLSTALWRLRQVLEPPGIPRGTYLIGQSDAVGFNATSDYWLDVAAFEEGIERGAEDAIACYTGDLLEGFFDDWVLRERERLRMLYLDGLGRLLRRHSETGALERALHCGQQILAFDPLREDIHRELIRLHLRSGHRALALQQYEHCRASLQQELGVEPMDETRALCASLHPPKAPTAPPRPPIGPRLRMAAAKLDEVRDAIADVLRVAESDQK
jgi:DNA-binding SARP family transcriptional activator